MYKVKRLFADAETGKTYAAGDTFDGRPERVAELQLAGLLNRTPVRPEPDKPAPGKGK